MGESCVFKSNAPSVTKAWGDTQAEFALFNMRVRDLDKRYPDHGVLTTQSGFYGTSVRVYGLRGEQSPGEGWRYVRNQDAWVPDKRRKAGKALFEELRSLDVKGLGILPGMPSSVMLPGHWYSHAALGHEMTVYVRWGISGEPVTADKEFDGGLWERCPESEWFLAVEAREAAASGSRDGET